jgi:RNA polymerase primary sigma factor
MARSPQRSAFRQYLDEIGEHPLLTAEEEQELGRRIQQDNDPAARERLTVCNLRLVVSIAQDYGRRGVDIMDLIEEGNLGLMRAVEKFDPERGVRFSTYATYWIARSVRRAVGSEQRLIHVPAYMIELVARAKRAQSRLRARLDREPSMKEVQKEMGLKTRQARVLQKVLGADTTSIYADPTGGKHEVTLSAILPARDTDQPEDVVFGEMEQQTLDSLLESIDDREGRVLSLRYGLEGEGPKTLREVATVVGLSRERVRQIEHEALAKLKGALEDAGYSEPEPA